MKYENYFNQLTDIFDTDSRTLSVFPFAFNHRINSEKKNHGSKKKNWYGILCDGDGVHHILSSI